MTEPEEQEPTEPTVTDVPEPDQPTEEERDEEEAHEAEPPEGEPTEPTEGEPSEGTASNTGEQANVQASAVDEKEIERQFKALVKHATSNSNAISRIMGEDAQHLEPCPRCMGGDPSMPKTPGFIWPATIVPLLPEHKAAVKLSIGEGVEVEWKAAEDASKCPKCDGRGKVKTGSSVPGQEKLKCLDCQGRGWIGPREHRGDVPTPNGVPENVPVLAGVSDQPPESDPWGRLRDDPLYGVMPGFERD